jgi:hypothetical protein
MALRYYPSFRILKNQNTSGKDFFLNGLPYVGKYYLTYDGKAYSGPDPITGPNQLLSKIPNYSSSPALANSNVPQSVKNTISKNTIIPKQPTEAQKLAKPNKVFGAPTPYYPQPLESDYQKGYIIRYFTKKENNIGYVIEISQDEYNSIVNGTADYDISIYQTVTILWKLTGPLNTIRLSQYDIRAGIIDTNKRLVENANKTFIGITDFIGGDYTKFARPTT